MALEQDQKDEDERPTTGDDTDDPCTNAESSECEDTAVHEEDGDFDQGEVDDVDDLIPENSLSLLMSVDLFRVTSTGTLPWLSMSGCPR